MGRFRQKLLNFVVFIANEEPVTQLHTIVGCVTLFSHYLIPNTPRSYELRPLLHWISALVGKKGRETLFPHF